MVLLEGKHDMYITSLYGCCSTIFRTGTVKTGNYILAINGDTLTGKTLSQAEEMLESCGNTVTLKIKKNIKQSSKMLY